MEKKVKSTWREEGGEKRNLKKNFWTAPHEYFTPLTYSKWTLSIWCIMDINFVNCVSFYSNVFHDVPQADSLCGDLTSGSNDVSEVKSKFVWLTASLLDQWCCSCWGFWHEDSCHSLSSHWYGSWFPFGVKVTNRASCIYYNFLFIQSQETNTSGITTTSASYTKSVFFDNLHHYVTL